MIAHSHRFIDSLVLEGLSRNELDFVSRYLQFLGPSLNRLTWRKQQPIKGNALRHVCLKDTSKLKQLVYEMRFKGPDSDPNEIAAAISPVLSTLQEFILDVHSALVKGIPDVDLSAIDEVLAHATSLRTFIFNARYTVADKEFRDKSYWLSVLLSLFPLCQARGILDVRFTEYKGWTL